MRLLTFVSIFLAALQCGASNVAQQAEKVGGHLYAAVVWHESQHGNWTNGHDLGPAQVNRKTAKAYGFNIARLQHDTRYNIWAGYVVLKDIEKRWPGQWCRYNVGSGPLKGQKLERCKRYIQKVRSERKALYGS